MSYFELIVTPNSFNEEFEFALASTLDRALESRDGSAVFAFEEIDLNAEQAVYTLAKFFEIECKIAWSELQSANWIENYKKSITPVHCGRFFVRPSWHNKRDDLIDLIIDPELVFGTGHHETTCGALEALSDLDLMGKTVADIGSGSGILAIAAAKLGAVISLCDSDKVAVEESIKNARLNSVQIASSWVGSADKSDEKFDIVVANIVTDVLLAIKNHLIERLKSGGELILSGVLNRHEERLKNAFLDLDLIRVIQKGEWLTFVYKKR